ncbi:mannosyl-oligosaccharide alpha-1,2-mannosidase [Puccinia graminis f. sp. tritici]|uniref:alpha-1,2-Mannosidase n=1 Tax=Puccinia graminis f. sp. tritici TaxID=56615 RepID=A0A5B0PP55_PUCGR|nr:mannosyl-oligosaccharide alpha-1,2-mannosidase [Puccinia graminis f. sp. tritici]
MMSDLRHRGHTTISSAAQQKQSITSSRSKKEPESQGRRNLVVVFLLAVGCLLVYYRRLSPTAEPESNTDRTSNTFNRYPLPTLPWESSARSAIKTAIKNSWRAYADSPAWGSDEFHPISQTGSNLTKAGSIGFFIVDVIDTILLTGDMDEEYQRARKYVERDLSFDVDGDLNAFETTIRILGGLLSVYHLSGNDTIYLEKAIDLGTRLLPIFDSPTGIPYSFINLKTGKATPDRDNGGYSSLAEATTIQLEFKYLAELSQKRIFWDVAEGAMKVFKHSESHHGLFPILVSPQDGSFFYVIRLGSRGDSYYEYLIKQYLQTNRTQGVYREMYDEAMTGVKEELVRETPGGVVYVGELHPSRKSYRFLPKQDHLVCFLGGLLLLGVTEGDRTLQDQDVLKLPDSNQEDWVLGKELIKSCVNTYELSKTGLGPEIVHFINRPEDFDKIKKREWGIPNYSPRSPPLDARNILRPETVESLFLAWRTTKDPIYREWGWQIFQAFDEHCKVKATGAFSSIKDVEQIPAPRENKMETFWLAETLKYLLLLFSDDSLIPLNSYVFNTEAHIFPIFTPSFKSEED